MGHPKITIFLFLGLLAGCGKTERPVDVPFVARFGSADIRCGASPGVVLTDLRLYVTDVVLTGQQGDRHPLRLSADALWQDDGIAMLDLENGQDSCQNGTLAENHVVKGRLPAGDYRGLEFTVGVPEALNHRDPLRATAPLNRSAMHWHWRSGYQFMRAGIERDGQRLRLHLGSARCKGTVSNIEGCASSNRVTVALPDFDPSGDTVSIDLQALLSGLGANDAAPRSCSSGPAEKSCAAPFAALGLDFATGDMAQGGRVFGIARTR